MALNDGRRSLSPKGKTVVATQRQLDFGTTENEIIQMFAHKILHNLCEEPQRSSFFGISADSSTDVIACKQFSSTLQFVDASSVTHSAFFDFYVVSDSKAETLISTIKDMFTRFYLPLFKLQEYVLTECLKQGFPNF